MKTVKYKKTNRVPVMNTLYHVFRIILGAVLIYASIDKIIYPNAFAKIIYNYQILPGDAINVAALVLPWLELVTGLFLIFQIWTPGTTVLTNILLIVFMGAIIFALARGLNIDCGCFSISGGKSAINTMTLFRDFSFILMALFLLAATFFPQRTTAFFCKDTECR